MVKARRVERMVGRCLGGHLPTARPHFGATGSSPGDRYAAEDFGLHEGELRERFAAYRRRFDLHEPDAER